MNNLFSKKLSFVRRDMIEKMAGNHSIQHYDGVYYVRNQLVSAKTCDFIYNFIWLINESHNGFRNTFKSLEIDNKNWTIKIF